MKKVIKKEKSVEERIKDLEKGVEDLANFANYIVNKIQNLYDWTEKHEKKK